MRSSRSTEAPIGNVRIDICIVSPVEDVEQFKPELEVDAFRDRCVFVEVCIRLKEVRSTELHGFFVTFRSEGRGSEVCLWNRPSQPGLVICRLLISAGIRIVEVVTVSGKVAALRAIPNGRICR